jgi:hypothetical protein
MNVCQKFVALAAGACLVSAFAVVGCESTAGPAASSGQTESSGQAAPPNASSGQTESSGAGSGQAESSDASSGQMETPDASAGQAETPDASSGPTGTADDASSVLTGTPDASGGCPMYPGVTVNEVDAGAQSPTWNCIEKNCSKQLATCAADCKCNDIILKAFFAAHDLASANASFKAALANGSPPADAILVGVCLKNNQASCPMWGSSSSDAAAGD